MRISVISVTENGRVLSERIAGLLPGDEVRRLCHEGHTDGGAETFGRLGDIVGRLWESSEALVFVCACGIAVRSIAPYVRSKQTDPAVIVIDDCGRFVIPVLSGHIGRANALAGRLAELIGATPVITTATDIGGRFSPDSFAAANGLIVTDFEAAKLIAAAVLDGERIGLVSEYEVRNLPPELTLDGGCRCGIYIGCGAKMPFPVTLVLVPKNIVLGIGCKRGTSAGCISDTVLKALLDAWIGMKRVCTVASIDLKSGEAGLLSFAESLGAETRFFTAEQLAAAEGEFSPSEFVRSVTGVDNVCERSAVCCGGALIMRKFAENGVTVAAAELPVEIDFERKIL